MIWARCDDRCCSDGVIKGNAGFSEISLLTDMRQASQNRRELPRADFGPSVPLVTFQITD
jgi:hypothetical protein